MRFLRSPHSPALPLLLSVLAAGTMDGAPVVPSPTPPQAHPLSEVRGFGLATPGGRGGRILRVTTLARAGEGSLAAALEAEGPRIVVFEVGGVIDLGGEAIPIRNPLLTVAGQTAPPPGITLVRGGLQIQAHDVILQHLAVRPGEAGAAKRSGLELDGIATGAGARDVVVDHCSTTWATDENLSVSGPRFEGDTVGEWRAGTSHRITISHCIIAEALRDSTHAKGRHSMGTLLHDNVTDVLLYGNLYASNHERHPLAKGGAAFAMVNNVVHNPGRHIIHYALVPEQWEPRPHLAGRMSVVGNVIRHGPDTVPGTPAALFQSGAVEVFWQDNVFEASPAAPLFRGAATFAATPPVWDEGLAPIPSGDVLEHVLRHAGARPWDRDPIDRRIVESVRNGSSRIIDDEETVGGYPGPEPTRRAFRPAEWDLDSMAPRGSEDGARGG